MSSTNATFATKASGSVVCSSAISMETTNEGSGSEAVEAKVASLTFFECKLTGSTCTVTAVNLPLKGTIAHSTQPNGNLTLGSGGAGSPGATVLCGAVINCTYTVSSPVLTFEGGNPAQVKATAITLTGTGKACPAAKLSGEWKLKAPNAGKVFVALQKVQKIALCEEAALAEPCASLYPKEQVLEGPGSAKFSLIGGPEVTCTGGAVKAHSEALSAPLPSLPAHLDQLNFSGCETPGPIGPIACNVALTNPGGVSAPIFPMRGALGAGNGEIAAGFILEISACLVPVPENCFYGAAGRLKLIGNAFPYIEAAGMAVAARPGSSPECPIGGAYQARYNLTNPPTAVSGLFVTRR